MNDYKVLFLGNGFEASYNSNMKNFNISFFDWIKNLSTEGKSEVITDLVKILSEDLNEESAKDMLNDAITLLENLKIDFNLKIEDIFSKIGKDIVDDHNTSKTLDINYVDFLNETFLVFKAIVGYFIDKHTSNINKKLNEKFNIEFSLDENYPSLIYSTNYTISPLIISKALKTSFRNINVIYLHGYINPSFANPYKELEINLIRKNIDLIPLSEIIEDGEYDLLSVDVFGLNLSYDNHIINNLMSISDDWNQTNVEINYYYYDYVEIEITKTQFINAFNGKRKHNVRIEEKEMDVNFFYDWHNKDVPVFTINFLNYKEYFLYREIQKYNKSLI